MRATPHEHALIFLDGELQLLRWWECHVYSIVVI